MNEYSIFLLFVQHPWLAIEVVFGLFVLLILPSQVRLLRVRGRVRVVYTSPLVHYEHNHSGWSLQLPGVAWLQTTFLGLMGDVWRGRGLQFARHFIAGLFKALISLVQSKF